MELGSLAVGAAVGGSSGASAALAGDRFNRQLHIQEIDLIAASAEGYAKRQCGCSSPSSADVAAAERALAEQAYRQVQYGTEGEWDQEASNYLRQISQGQQLGPDPHRPGSGYSPLFYAMPSEKADALQYIGSWDLRSDFYGRNGIELPSQERAMAAAIQDQMDRKNHTATLLGGTSAIVAGGLSPVALAAARGCISNPGRCNEIAVAAIEAASGDALGGHAISTGAAAIVAAASLERITARSTSAASAISLRNQLAAQEIAAGHAFEKHVIIQGEFSGLDIRTPAQFASHIENVITNPSSVRYYRDGRTVYLQESTGTVVIRNPSGGEGTAFRPDDWAKYLSTLPSKSTPY